MMIPFFLSGAGLLLIFLEFFLPGAIMGVLGGLFLLGSIVVFLLTSPTPFVFLVYLAAIAIAVFLVIRLAIWAVKRKKGTIYLDKDQEGFQASLLEKEMIGKRGVAATDLRPSGHILIENKRIQVSAREGFIEKGQEVEVVAGEGSRLIVILVR